LARTSCIAQAEFAEGQRTLRQPAGFCPMAPAELFHKGRNFQWYMVFNLG
jgi:hypothetical protein